MELNIDGWKLVIFIYVTRGKDIGMVGEKNKGENSKLHLLAHFD